jgi:hypothetical protein
MHVLHTGCEGKLMDFDLEHNVLSSAADLFGFALRETTTEAQHRKAVEEIIRDVLERYPNVSAPLLAFAMGRALGRLEGRPREKRQ